MYGTLEVKQEGLTTDAVKRPEWMEEVSADAMTDEQRKVRSEYCRYPLFGCVCREISGCRVGQEPVRMAVITLCSRW